MIVVGYRGGGRPCKKDGNVRRVKKAIAVHVGVFSLKGSTVGAFPVRFRVLSRIHIQATPTIQDIGIS